MCKRFGVHDASAHDVSDSVSGLLQGACQLEKVQKSAEKSADELPEKWQGFDHINGAKMAVLARIMVINNAFLVMIITSYHNHESKKRRF